MVSAVTSTNKISDEGLGKLRLILISRFRIVMALYPDKSLSQNDLAKLSGTDPGNLSRYIPEMIDRGVLVSNEETLGVGRPSNMISLSYEARDIINQNMRFLLQDESNVKELKTEIEEKLLELLGEESTLVMAADELQRISRQYKLSPESR